MSISLLTSAWNSNFSAFCLCSRGGVSLQAVVACQMKLTSSLRLPAADMNQLTLRLPRPQLLHWPSGRVHILHMIHKVLDLGTHQCREQEPRVRRLGFAPSNDAAKTSVSNSCRRAIKHRADPKVWSQCCFPTLIKPEVEISLALQRRLIESVVDIPG